MEKQDEKANKSSEALNELNDFLAKKKEIYNDAQKAERWWREDYEWFFEEHIEPVFKQLIDYFKTLHYLDVSYQKHRKVCKLMVKDKFDFFVFKVVCENSCRAVVFSHEILYRNARRTKLLKINNSEREYISFDEPHKATEEYIVALFTKWYKAKDEIIAKTKQLLIVNDK